MTLYERLIRSEIVLGGLFILFVFCSMTVYTVVFLHAAFMPGDFGMGASAVLGAMGGGQGVRDWLANKGSAQPCSDLRLPE